jgi:hypothetical protein
LLLVLGECHGGCIWFIGFAVWVLPPLLCSAYHDLLSTRASFDAGSYKVRGWLPLVTTCKVYRICYVHQSRLCFKFPCGYSCFATSSPLISRWFLIGTWFARGRFTVGSTNGLQLARVWLSARSGPWPVAGAHRSRVSGSPADTLIQISLRCFKLS